MIINHEIDIDIERDIRNHLLNEIAKLGYVYSGSDDFNTVATKFLMLKGRLVPIRKRIVACAKEMQVPAELQNGFSAFLSRAESGGDLRPYQSRKIDDETFVDAMFVEWGVQHFHLGEFLESDGFFSRTDPLLFALVTDSHIYCIGFWSHGDWADMEIVGKVHDNWPEVIARFRVTTAIGMDNLPSNDDLKKLRRNNVTSFFQPRPGIIYAPTAGGQTASGHSAFAMMHAINLLKRAREAQRQAIKYIETHIPQASAKIVATGHMIMGSTAGSTASCIEVRLHEGTPIARVPI